MGEAPAAPEWGAASPGVEPRFWPSPDPHPELDNQTRKEPQRRLGGAAAAPQAADGSSLGPMNPPPCSRTFCVPPGNSSVPGAGRRRRPVRTLGPEQPSSTPTRDSTQTPASGFSNGTLTCSVGLYYTYIYIILDFFSCNRLYSGCSSFWPGFSVLRPQPLLLSFRRVLRFQTHPPIFPHFCTWRAPPPH